MPRAPLALSAPSPEAEPHSHLFGALCRGLFLAHLTSRYLTPLLLLLFALLLLTAMGVSAVEARPPKESPPTPAASSPASTRYLEVTDPSLRFRLYQLERKSPRLHKTLRLARRGPYRIVIGTPEQVGRAFPGESIPPMHPNDLAHFGMLLPHEPGSLTPRGLFIRVDLDRIRTLSEVMGERRPSAQARATWTNRLLEDILIHEVGGHLAPVLEAGDLSGDCPDPAPADPEPLRACSMQREAQIRRELALPQRTSYDLLELLKGR